MELLPQPVYSTWKRYWRRKRYQRLDGTTTGRRNMKIVRFGGNPRRVWKIRALPKLKFKIISPSKLWKKLKNAYVDMMLGLAGDVGSLNTNNYFGSKRIPKARQASPSMMPMSSVMFPSYQQQKTESYEQDKHSQFEQPQKQKMEMLWKQEMKNIQNMTEFKSKNELPLARIKRIMKSDKEVKMVSAETPVLFSKACELFILELAFRGWLLTEASGRRTIQRCDIAKAIRQHEILDFLTDLVPCEHEDEQPRKSTGGSATQLLCNFPEINGDFFLHNDAGPQSFMIETPRMPSTQFSSETAPK